MSETVFIDPDREAWGPAFIAEYPSSQVYIDTVRDAERRVLVAHRTADAADSRLICMSPRAPGEGFGE